MVVVAAFAAAACSGGVGLGTARPATPGEVADSGPCLYLTESEAAALAGKPVIAGGPIDPGGGIAFCQYIYWHDPSEYVGVFVGGPEKHQENKDFWSGERAVPGLGTDAIWSEESGQLSVLARGRTLEVVVQPANRFSLARAVAEKAISRL